MSARNRVRLLILVMTSVALAGGGTAIFVLYRAALEQQRVRLTEIAKSHARLVESVARFDAKYSTEDFPGGAFAATLMQIKDAHSRLEGFAETGEFTLAKREGEQIVFLLDHRHDEIEEPAPVPFSSELAEPMRRALSEQSGGTVVGLDYRGETVLAAYEPVSVLDLGIVAKIDLKEVRKPFVKAGLLAGGVALVLISFGTVLFLQIGNPIVEQLRESEERLNLALESARIGAFDWNILENSITWDDHSHLVFGREPGTCQGGIEGLVDMLHPDDRELVKRAVARSVEEDAEYDAEYRVVWPDGSQHDLATRGKVYHDRKGRAVRMAGVVWDVTERKKAVVALRKARDELEKRVEERTAELAEANELLRENEERLRRQATVLQAINDVFRVTLASETEEELGKTCLAVAERLTGSKFGLLGELNAAGLMDTVAISNPGWDACEVAASDARRAITDMPIRGILGTTLREGTAQIVNGDEIATHPDRVGLPEGHPRITAFLGVPLKSEGKTIGIIGLGNKPSGYALADQEAVEHLGVAVVEALRKKRTESQLREARDEVVRKTRLAAIGQLSASIAHDLRNPLGAVNNAVYLLKRRITPDDRRAARYLEIMEMDLARSEEIISNLLAVARARPPRKQAVDLRQVVETVSTQVAHTDKIVFSFSLNPDPFVLHADPDQLHQVVVNILQNAIDAMRASGVFSIQADRNEDFETVVFSDTGTGVAREVRQTLFDPLVTTKTNGTGLGLAICREIIENHGGTIQAEDAPTTGAAFCLRLPRQTESREK